MDNITAWITISFAVSAVCSWLSQYIAALNSAKLGKQLRYDIYFCYFRKLKQQLMSSTNKLKMLINEKESRNAFNFPNINQDIAVFQEDMKNQRPKRIKAFFLILISVAFLISTSWQLSLLAIGGLLLIAIINLILSLMCSKDVPQESLLKIVHNSFKMEACTADFNVVVHRFDGANEEMYKKEKKLICAGSARSLVSGMLYNVYWISMVLYIKRMYEDGRDTDPAANGNTGLMNATIGVDQIFVYILYFVEILRHAAVLGSADAKEHKKKMAKAESELFSAVKM